MMVDGRSSPSFVRKSALEKQILSYSNIAFSFHPVRAAFCFVIGPEYYRIEESELSVFACGRMLAIIKNRLLLSA